jgi:flagellar motor switch protein FliN/FliY
MPDDENIQDENKDIQDAQGETSSIGEDIPEINPEIEIPADDVEIPTENAENPEISSETEAKTYDFSNTDNNKDHTVTVQPVKFASFENSEHAQGEQNKNLDLLMDIKLQLTVELGRTELPIKKVLELTRGSIIELEKVAGEPVELYANGKLVAQGEVVVIEDNFGLRITSITEPEERIKGVGKDKE